MGLAFWNEEERGFFIFFEFQIRLIIQEMGLNLLFVPFFMFIISFEKSYFRKYVWKRGENKVMKGGIEPCQNELILFLS